MTVTFIVLILKIYQLTKINYTQQYNDILFIFYNFAIITKHHANKIAW